jgi:putative ABC transport system permease protein
MLKRYIKLAVRILLKHRAYTIISILGLAIGLGISMVSISYIIRELRWEDCHEKHDNIYRVEMQYQHADTSWSSARVMAPLGDAISREIPGVDQAAVFRHARRVTLQIVQKKYQAGNLIFAGPEFFDVFTFPLMVGDPEASLANPNSILITDSIARTYFPSQNPLGETISINDSTEFTITGILEDLPLTTHLHCDFVASYSTLDATAANLDSWISGSSDLTYLLLDNSVKPEIVESRIPEIFSRHVDADISNRYSFTLKPFKDIYFSTYYSGNAGEIWPGGEYDVTIMILAIGLFILIQSIVNFISLSTSRAVDRMKEVGIRKTFGAARSKLIAQFLGESVLLTFGAMIVGLFFYDFFRRGFTSVTPDKIPLVNLYTEPSTILLLIVFTITVGVLAGFYPAIYLSRFKPISVLKDTSSKGKSRSFIRKSLGVFQFTLAIFFITLTLGYRNQVNHLTDYDLGFEKENIMVLKFTGDALTAEDCALAKNEILAHNDVLGAARSDGVLGSRMAYGVYYSNPELDDTNRIITKQYTVDYDFLSFYGIDLIKGRGFSDNRPEDINHAVLINESMANDLELENPIGYKLFTESVTYEVVGVVKDFHGNALDFSYQSKSVIVLYPDVCRVLCIRLNPDDISGSVASIGTTWNNIFGDREFNYTFLDDNIRTQYSELNEISGLFGILSIISIIIACLGIFGLISFTINRKTKELAIRKVLGASVTSISKILTKEFVILITISNLIACPLAYMMIKWSLEEYAVRANMGVFTYFMGGVLTILIVLTTSGYHILKAAHANPTDALKYE